MWTLRRDDAPASRTRGSSRIQRGRANSHAARQLRRQGALGHQPDLPFSSPSGKWFWSRFWLIVEPCENLNQPGWFLVFWFWFWFSVCFVVGPCENQSQPGWAAVRFFRGLAGSWILVPGSWFVVLVKVLDQNLSQAGSWFRFWTKSEHLNQEPARLLVLVSGYESRCLVTVLMHLRGSMF